jgi:hypothetical protein
MKQKKKMKNKENILIGYELKTAEEVSIFPSHLVVTGLTQLSGKTTTLEALIERSKSRAIVFKTKRGEEGFSKGTIIRPFFKEKSDWQFVSSLLEATMKERLKFERSWIIRACRGTKNLKEVYEKCKKLQEESREGSIHQGVYTTLIAYFELILPQIEGLSFSTELNLKEGINIMDLEKFSGEVQSLIIRSTLDYVLNNEKGVIVVIPEFWKFCPQQRGNPVKQIAEEFIRQGATRKNFLWADSQDLANVDKTILKQVANWILGLQTEINEVQHTLEQIPLPNNLKPKAEEIMTLRIGHFIVCNPYFTKRVYVQPAWLDEETAKKIALGIIPVETVLGKKKIKIKDISRAEEIALDQSRLREIEFSKKISVLEKEIDKLKEKNEKLEQNLQKKFSIDKQQIDKLKSQKNIQMKYNAVIKKIKTFAQHLEEVEIKQETEKSMDTYGYPMPENNHQVQVQPQYPQSSPKRLLIANLPPYEKEIMEGIVPHPNIPFTRSQLAVKSKKSYTSSQYLSAIRKLIKLDLLKEQSGDLYFIE